MKLKLIFILIALSSYGKTEITRSKQEASITSISSDLFKNQGDDVELSCSVHNPESLSVLWSKTYQNNANDQTVLTVNNVMLVPDSRYSISTDKGTFTLKIRNLQLSDVGAFECMIVVSVMKKITKTVNLAISGPPIIKNNRSASELIIKENTKAELFCDAQGYPIPKIEWTREGDASGFPKDTIFEDGNKRVILNPVSKEHRGKYYCTATNAYGDHRKAFLVKVEFPPVIISNVSSVEAALGDELSLMCAVEAYPPPKIEWFDGNDTRLENGNADYLISNVGVGNDAVWSEIYIPNVNKNYTGEYSCLATNELGFVKTNIHLTVKELGWFGKIKRFFRNLV